MIVRTENGCRLNTEKIDCRFKYDKKTDELFIEWKDFIVGETLTPATIRDKVTELREVHRWK